MKPILGVIPSLGLNMDRLNAAIQSVKNQSLRELVHLVVVDNSDGSLLSALEDVDEILDPKCNLGYNAAIEYARRKYRSDYLWILQDDLIVHNDCLTLLYQRLQKNQNLAAISPISIDRNSVPRGVRAGYFTNSSRTEYRYLTAEETHQGFPKEKEIAWISGSAALYREKAIDEIGGLNLALYPVQGTDIDLSFRLTLTGWLIDLEPKAHVSHRGNGSSPNFFKKMVERKNNQINKKTLLRESTQSSINLDIDIDILSAVAQRASYLLIELAQHSQARISELEKQVEELKIQNIKEL